MPATHRCAIRSAEGWALVEILTALALTALFLGAVFQTTLSLTRCLTQWEESARMRQTLSAVLAYMSRDIRMAGSNPTGKAVFEGVILIQEAGATPERVEIRMDKRGSAPGSLADGDIEDPDEVVVYRWDDEHRVLRRNHQPLADRIVENPWGVPVFDLMEDGSHGLMRLSVTTRTPLGSLSLSTAVRIRNPL